MTQLDFTDCEPIRTAERQERHDAFWGPLNEVRRTATRVACDFFAFACEANLQMATSRRHEKTDAEKSQEAFVRVQMYSKFAIEKFRLFGRLTGCVDDAEAIERLDRLVGYSRQTGWQIYPGWWLKNPQKTTAYFIDKLKTYAGQRIAYLEMLRKVAEAHAKEGGAK